MSGNKKRGRGGQQAAKGSQQDRRYWLTSLGANIHKCGRYQDVNRDTAKWRNDVHDMLRTEGGRAAGCAWGGAERHPDEHHRDHQDDGVILVVVC